MPVLEHPEWAWPLGLVVLGALGGLAIAARMRRRRGVRLLGERFAPGHGATLHDALLVGALVLLAIALVGPRLGHAPLRATGAGADVVLLVDLSRSMDAADTAPSRLRRAVATAEALLERLDAADRVALAGFAGRGVLFTPLTPDRHALADMLRHLDTRLMGASGSALDRGIAAATGAFEPAADRPRVIVVLSDGEVSDPDGATGAGDARRAHARGER